jgi:ubiquinone/menaquinone biosynthesis C-methylase UbiE
MDDNNPFDDSRIASAYEDWFHTTGKKAADQEKRLLRSLINQFDEVHTILDVGCGTGYFTNWAHQHGIKVFGLDRSLAMLHQAQKYVALDCCLGDALSLPFSSQSFDLVSLITVLEFVDDPIFVLREGFRVTRRGLIIGAINRHSLLGISYHLKGGPIWKEARLFTTGELIKMLSEIAPVPYKLTYQTTLWPIYPGSIGLPWGGFVGVAMVLEG